MFSWYALKVSTRREARIEEHLRAQEYETLLPTYIERRPYSDRVKKVPTAVFPGYLFCKLDAERGLPILMTPGVHSIVSFNSRPAPIDPAEMTALHSVIKARAELQPWPWVPEGTRVRIECGPLAGVEAVLVRTKGADRVILSVSLLQRSVAVEIDRASIRPLNGAVAMHSATV